MERIDLQSERLIRFKPGIADFGWCKKLDAQRREKRLEMERAGKAVDIRK